MPPIINVGKAFKVAVDNGNRVIDIDLGEHDVDDRIAEIAVMQLKVAEYVDGPNTPKPDLQKPKTRARGKNNASISNNPAGEA